MRGDIGSGARERGCRRWDSWGTNWGTNWGMYVGTGWGTDWGTDWGTEWGAGWGTNSSMDLGRGKMAEARDGLRVDGSARRWDCSSRKPSLGDRSVEVKL